MRVLIYNEGIHEQQAGGVHGHYPHGIHGALSNAIEKRIAAARIEVVTLADVERLSPETLGEADVLIWWSHLAHDRVPEAVVSAVHAAVLGGLGLLVLHSSAESRVFRRLMGTTCSFRWREANDRELVWVTDPGHPIAAGLPAVIELEQHEMYGEYFDIPTPDSVVFTSWFSGGEVFRSGCTFTRGAGRIFYFSPGHETYPIYHHPLIQDVLANAARWLARREPPRPPRGFIRSETDWYR